ncbi:hypothetical protein K488DRAFT_44429 [Vararia minispora EC-137]|uniref:Uncharacterized protein n=1 Tax=Vararia minispora EC-137 TaxID=1314806 RepID=A0ACB8QSW6_9AGAM|nr:hypothetical protein K488DRAFT_44429 [Vararia minispora EC-137]
MAPSVQGAIGGFVGSVSHIGSDIVQAVFTLFGAFLAFGQALMTAALQAGQAVLKLGTDLFQSVAGFVFANFFVLMIIGGGYYLYTTRSQGKGKSTRRTK